jgi:hypothetical protein
LRVPRMWLVTPPTMASAPRSEQLTMPPTG